jgi:hypothetical protein
MKKKNKNIIEYEELPRNIQHALEILVEWHGVLVYETEKNTYAFTIIEVDMYDHESKFVESEYVNAHHYIHISVLDIINTKFKGIRCRYFPKGFLSDGAMQLESITVCSLHRGYGFSIEVHSADYGFMDNDIAPAYAHVLDPEGLEIGLLNIAGPCPKKISDVKEFRPPYDVADGIPMKVTPLMKHRRNIVKWANSHLRHHDTGEYYKENRWNMTKTDWTFVHSGKR